MTEERRPVGRFAIYALTGKGGEIRYIGKATDPKKRLYNHLTSARLERSNKDRWVLAAHNAGVLNIIVLEWTDDWKEAERRWIAKGRAEGWRLLNIAPGGDDTSHLHTPERKAKRNSSLFRKVICAMSHAEMDAREIVPDVAARVREHILFFRKTFAAIKRKHGDEAADQYGAWLYNELMPERKAARRGSAI